MNQIQVKLFTFTSIIIAALIWGITFLLLKFNVVSLESLKYLNLAISAAGLFWYSYFKWAWKWPYVRHLMYKPNLNGTWLGEVESDWLNEKGQVNPPKKIVLVVRQHWFSVSIKAFTDIQTTESYVETLLLNESRGVKILAYLYSEKSSRALEHGSRQGAGELDLLENGSMKILSGHFWTYAKTRGFIKVRQVSSNLFVESFEEAEETWTNKDKWASIKIVRA